MISCQYKFFPKHRVALLHLAWDGLNRGPGRSKQGTRGPGTKDRGPRTRTEDQDPGTEDQDPGPDPFFCMGGCGTHIEITNAKHQDFALHCRIHWSKQLGDPRTGDQGPKTEDRGPRTRI